jgi:hypothetical protein
MAGIVETTTQRSGERVDTHLAQRRSVLSRFSLGHVIMIVAGLAAFLLVFSLLQSRDQTSFIAVASSELPAGTTVTEDAFSFVELGASDSAVLGSLLSPLQASQAIDEQWAVTRTIPAGDPVRFSDFRTDPNPTNLRAMSIPIDRGHAVAGALQAGDLIDVIVVRKGVASYVAGGIEVLDVAESETRFGGEFGVTVAVDADTSLRIASALWDGNIEIVRATGAIDANPESFYDPLGLSDNADEG